MSGSFEGTRLLVFFVLLCYCVFSTQGKAKIPSVDDCKKMPYYLECRNRGVSTLFLRILVNVFLDIKCMQSFAEVEKCVVGCFFCNF